MGTQSRRAYRFILCLLAESKTPTVAEREQAPVIFRGLGGGSQLDSHTPELTARKVLN